MVYLFFKQSLILIDFGSAADMDPVSGSGNQVLAAMGLGNGGRVGLDTSTVAISPIYAAPEVFVKWDREPLTFDVFSAALIYCQLLFNLLDDRTDAAFRQQLEDAKYDLDAWLARELASTVRSAGFEDGLQYVAERPGLWGLLKRMLHPHPEKRQSSRGSLRRFKKIMNGYENPEEDGFYFQDVIEASEECEIPDDFDGPSPVPSSSGVQESMPSAMTEGALVMPRPLHFVATFDRANSLGLLLSEAGADDEELEEMDDESKELWKVATASAKPSDVFVRGVVEGGQADSMNLYDVGDRLVGVGEIPIGNGGFEKVVKLVSCCLSRHVLYVRLSLLYSIFCFRRCPCLAFWLDGRFKISRNLPLL
jgi:serine/threonine protein kinase